MAKIGLRRAQATSDSADQQIRLEVARAFYGLLAARQSLVVAKASSQQTDEGLRIANDRYEAGLATMTDLLRTEDQQRQSQTNYWQALYSNVLRYTDLQFATGTLSADSAGDLQ
jgi:outer membrane protein TolC